ncbi:MAG: hypothetical protein PVH17_07435 [Anaerolineae bacterium]|jgi:hypothetical protein
MAKQASVRTRRDRWADWAVVGVLIVALLLGWAVMALAEGQRDTYTNTDAGLTVRYPEDWLHKAGENLAFRVVDPTSGDFKTTYEVRVRPIEATGATTSTLTVVLNDVSLARATKVSAYRLFETVEGREIDDHASMEARYVYVSEGGDLFLERMPVVVLGLDIAVARGDQAYVFTLLAAQDAFDKAEPAFRRFVKSAEIQ